MLKLTRRNFDDESIYIVDKDTDQPVAKVQVTSIVGGQVGLGLTAQKNINFVRNELLSEEKQIEYDTALKGSCPR